MNLIEIAPSNPANIMHLSWDWLSRAGDLSPTGFFAMTWRIGRIAPSLVGEAVEFLAGVAYVVWPPGVTLLIRGLHVSELGRLTA